MTELGLRAAAAKLEAAPPALAGVDAAAAVCRLALLTLLEKRVREVRPWPRPRAPARGEKYDLDRPLR
jgi:hypothetical protein